MIRKGYSDKKAISSAKAKFRIENKYQLFGGDSQVQLKSICSIRKVPSSKNTPKKPPVAQSAPPTENSNNNSVVNAPTVENEPQPVIEKKLLSEDDKKKIASIMKVLKKTGLQHALGALELETGLSKVNFKELHQAP